VGVALASTVAVDSTIIILMGMVLHLEVLEVQASMALQRKPWRSGGGVGYGPPGGGYAGSGGGGGGYRGDLKREGPGGYEDRDSKRPRY
jgi:uncharacterized membrane protein